MRTTVAEFDDRYCAVHGPTAAAHELVPGAPPWDRVQRLLFDEGQRGHRRFAATYVTRSNCRALIELVRRLVAQGVTGWALVWPRGQSLLDHVPPVVARLGIAVPHALRAAQWARDRGLHVGLHGFPRCTLGPFAALAVAEPGVEHVATACGTCPARRECAGVDAGYLDRFDTHELRPVAAVPATRRAPEVLTGLATAVAELRGGR